MPSTSGTTLTVRVYGYAFHLWHHLRVVVTTSFLEMGSPTPLPAKSTTSDNGLYKYGRPENDLTGST